MRTIAPLFALLLTLPLPTVAGAQRRHARSASAAPVARFDWFDYTRRTTRCTTCTRPARASIATRSSPASIPTRASRASATTTTSSTSTFAYFPGIPIFRSKDLVNWTQIGNAIDRPEQLKFDSLGMSRGVFAPTINYHDGTFYVLNTCVDCGGNFLVTATNPAGPWSNPVWLPRSRRHRPVDSSSTTTARRDVVNNGAPTGAPRYDGHRAIWIQEFDLAAKKRVGPGDA